MLYDSMIFEEIALLGEVLAAVADADEPIPVVELDRVLALDWPPPINDWAGTTPP